MASSITGQAILACFGKKPRKQFDINVLVSQVARDLAYAQNDMNKAGDVDDVHYYSGLVDAYDIVLRNIMPFKSKPRYFEMMGFKLLRDAAVKKAKAA